MKRLAILVAVALCACGGDEGGGGGGGDNPCDPGGDAYFRVETTGGSALAIDAVAGEFGCGGSSFPDGTAFSSAWGNLQTQHVGSEIAFTIDVRGVARGQTGAFAGDITVGQGGSDDGTFLGGLWVGDEGACTFELTRHDLVGESAVGDLYIIEGSGTCPTIEDGLISDDPLTVSGLAFLGVTVWTPE